MTRTKPRVGNSHPRIGTIFVPTDPYWIQALEAITHTCHQLGDELVILQPASSNQALHSIPPEDLVDYVLAHGLDALICAIGSIPILHALADEQLPVICLDEIDPGERHPYLTVAASLYAGGKMAAQYVAQRLRGKGHALCIDAGQEEISITGQSRLSGFLGGIRRYPRIHTHHVPAFWRYDQTFPVLLAALKNYPGPVNAIFGVSDTIILAARDAGRTVGAIDDRTVLVGVNGDPLALAAIVEGSLSATVNIASEELAAAATRLAHQAVLGKPLPATIPQQFQLITRRNVAGVAARKLVAIADIPTHMVGYSRQQEHDRLSQLEISTEITRQIGSLGEREQVAQVIGKFVSLHYGYDWVRILRWSEEDRSLVLFGGVPSPASQQVPLEQDLLVHQVYSSNEAVIIPDTKISHRWHMEPEYDQVRSRAVLPIPLGAHVIGVLDLQSSRPVAQPSLEIVGLKLLASQLGIVLQNDDLYRDAIQARQAAEKANQLKTRLIANVGHEMRTPLNIIMGYSQSIEKQLDRERAVPPERLTQDMRNIFKSGEHLMYMINDLLDLSRAEIGALSLFFEPLQLTPFLEELFREFSQSEPADPEVIWKLDLPSRLPVIRADVVRLRQILINLLSNSRKYTHAGSIALGASLEPPHVHLWVQDTGLGIPIQLQEKIFEPFVTAGGKRRPEGIGLGLSITRHLVALHGGTITLESQPGTGSTFNLYLPLPGLVQEPSRSAATGSPNVMLIISGRSIVPEQIRQLCERQSLVPCAIATRDDLQAAWSKGKPAAIAWDLAHATSAEWALLHSISSNQECAALPFMLFSPADGPDHIEAGLTQVVFKPCPENTLQAWIGHLTSVGQAGPVMIVDDDVECRAYYQRMLEKSRPQSRVLVAENGSQALALLEAETPSLVLLDLMMPEPDGFAVLERIRSLERTRSVPVVVVSGKALNYEDVQRLNHLRTVVLTKGILNENETGDFLLQMETEPHPLPRPTSLLIKRAIAFMHQNYAQPINRLDLARAAGVSENYLSQIFRQEMCISPLDYMNRLRIERAKGLLAEGEESVTWIATRVGFNDSAYFSRVFHKLTGQSPQEFRQSKR